MQHTLCRTVTEASFLTPLQTKQPAELPDHFELKCAFGDVYSYSLLFSNQSSISYDELQYCPSCKGVIVIDAALINEKTDPAYHIKNRTAELESNKNDFLKKGLQSRLAKISDHLAVIREQYYSMPSLIIFYDGDLLYRLSGQVQSIELEKMANSLS